MTSTMLIMGLFSAYLVISAFVRAWTMARRAKVSVPGPQSRTMIKAAAVAQGAGGVCLAIAMWRGAPMLINDFELVSPFHVLATSIFVSTLVQVAADWRWNHSARQLVLLVSSTVVGVIGIGALGALLYLRSVPGPAALAETVEFPLRGRWLAVAAGRSRLTNYHHGSPPQQDYAVDLMLAGNASGSEGQLVTSPVEALVAEVRRVDPDAGRAPAEGNLVILQSKSGAEIWLAHLQDNSVIVESGERVLAGQPIAKVGSSGSAEQPHLHIHAEKDGAPGVSSVRAWRAVPGTGRPNGRALNGLRVGG